MANGGCKNACADEANTIRAGRITGSPMTGLCDRVVISVTRVYDGCAMTIPSRAFILQLSDMTPGKTAPYTFVSATSNGLADLQNVTITPVTERRSRVQGDVVIPVLVRYIDAQGAPGTATSSVTFHRDVILNTPPRALVSFTAAAQGTLASETGTFIGDDRVSIICCSVILMKIIVPTDLVVPAYGLAVYPENCGGSEDLCAGLLSLSMFPPLD